MFNFRQIRNTIGKYFLGSDGVPMDGFWGWATPGGWSKRSFLKQYVRYVYTIVSARASEAAKINLEVYKNDKIAGSHPLLTLLKKPNPEQSQFQFLELHFTYMDLAGESFWYIARGAKSAKPKEIHLLRPDLVTPKRNKEFADGKDNPRGMVTHYEMELGNGKKQRFETTEILHFKLPNPNDPNRGLGIIEAAQTYIQTEDYSSDWTKNSIFNSGRPSGIVNVRGAITDEQFKSVKRQFKDTYTGTKNAGKTLLLKGAEGIDYTKLGLELGEVALKELKNMTRDDIMIMFRVSKTILGVSDDVNRANALEARAVFIRNVIVPICDRLMDHLNAFLMPEWSKESMGSVLKYQDPTLQSDEDRLAEWVAGYNKWLTKNDIRKERKLDPIAGGDVILEGINLVPTAGNIKGIPAKVEEKPVKEEPVKDKPTKEDDSEKSKKKRIKKS